MSSLDRVIAGISCRQVLADLSGVIDHELPEERVERLRAHVSSCRECEKFGGAVGQLVHMLRTLHDAPPLDEKMAERLRKRLHEQTDRL